MRDEISLMMRQASAAIASGNDAQLAQFVADQFNPFMDGLRAELLEAETAYEMTCTVLAMRQRQNGNGGRETARPAAARAEASATAEAPALSATIPPAGSAGASLDLDAHIPRLQNMSAKKAVFLVLLEAKGARLRSPAIIERLLSLGNAKAARNASSELTRAKRGTSDQPALVDHDAHEGWCLTTAGTEVARALAQQL